MSKGQGLSITTIVIAVLSLIVLIVLTLIFTGKLGNFQQSTSEQQASAEAQAQAIKFVGNACSGKVDEDVDSTPGTCKLSCGEGGVPLTGHTCGSTSTDQKVKDALLCCKK